MPKKVALFVDVDTLQHPLRTVHNRTLDPALVAAAAKARGEVVVAMALADWGELSPELKEAFKAQAIEPVQVDRLTKPRGEGGGRRREALRDVVDLELMARVIEVLFPADGGPEVDIFVLATTDEAAARTARLVRERFQKEVVAIGVEGVFPKALEEAPSAWELLPMPPIVPQDMEGLQKLTPLLEDLERKKRYLNFKYIRETVVRRLDLPERSFDAAERLLSEAIGCGLLLKHKIEDKYNPGQLFTAYALNRDNELFHRFGSGEPAPLHAEPEPGAPAAAEASEPAPAAATVAAGAEGAAPAAPPPGPAAVFTAPTLGRGPRGAGRGHDPRGRRDDRRPQPAHGGAEDGAPEADEVEGEPGGDLGDGRGRRRRRRRGRPGDGQGPPPGDRPPREPRDDRRGRGRGPERPERERAGSRYEAPRFLPDDAELPLVRDEDIDEDRILRALGDA